VKHRVSQGNHVEFDRKLSEIVLQHHRRHRLLRQAFDHQALPVNPRSQVGHRLPMGGLAAH
jgi:hypothetical protein